MKVIFRCDLTDAQRLELAKRFRIKHRLATRASVCEFLQACLDRALDVSDSELASDSSTRGGPGVIRQVSGGGRSALYDPTPRPGGPTPPEGVNPGSYLYGWRMAGARLGGRLS